MKAVPRVEDALANERELMSAFASVLRSNNIECGSKCYLCKKWLMEIFWVEAPLFAGCFWVPVLSSQPPARVSWMRSTHILRVHSQLSEQLLLGPVPVGLSLG